MLKVKNTKLVNLRRGDIIMHRAGSLFWPDWDVLGNVIKIFEGNTGTSRDPNAPGFGKGDYTHCDWVRDAPNPEAEVEEVKPGVYKIKDGSTWRVEEETPGKWVEEPILKVPRLASNMPIRVHATWPCVKEETIDLENPHIEVWRMRQATPEIIEGIVKLANDMIGYHYNLASFLTFGNFNLPNAEICSEFISDIAYNASLLLGKEYPICLTPDIASNEDKQKTPNDLVNSGELIKIAFQGLL